MTPTKSPILTDAPTPQYRAPKPHSIAIKLLPTEPAGIDARRRADADAECNMMFFPFFFVPPPPPLGHAKS